MAEAKKKQEDEEIDVKVESDDKPEAVEIDADEKKSKADDKGGKKAEDKDDTVQIEISEEDPAEREAIRQKRREERQSRKEARERTQAELARVTRENEMLRQSIASGEQRINSIEQRTISTDIAQIEAAIQQRQEYIERAKKMIEQGVAEQKGDAVAYATEAMSEARAEMQHLTRVRENIVQRQRQPAPTDPQVSMHAREWSKKNSWYDASQQDDDSAIAYTVDQRMSREGWNPRTAQYWVELDKRLASKLPHRYKKAVTEEEDDEEDERPSGSNTSGSGRESGGGGGKVIYTLTPDRVRALKEAGVWEDAAERAKYVRRFIQWDKEHKEAK